MSVAAHMRGPSEGTPVSGVHAIIDVARDFSKVPGGRFARLGPYSGEEFRKLHLVPALRAARKDNGRVTVILDGAAGYPASFLEEAFGGLIREEGFSLEEIARFLIIDAQAQRFQIRRDMAWSYIRAAEDLRSKI